MATFKELFGDKYDPAMKLEDAEKLFEGRRFADLSAGEYVSKAKYDADTRRLSELEAALGGKQAEIDAAAQKAAEEARKAAKADYDKQLELERTAVKRKRAKEKAYEGLTEEQRGIFDALLQEEQLTLAEDGESFSNFEELAKPIREKYRSLFPVDADGSKEKGGIPPAGGNGAGTGLDSPFRIFDLEKFQKHQNRE